ncbi:COG4223 family protein [Pelagibius marinus]|uniref:COG4223 family protein n=1 Tax=Pelagibius marinus TaxID=2762760 RepID=UPI001872CB8D|nr:mitofilin family membrane protein [Pelagibius marinus]
MTASDGKDTDKNTTEQQPEAAEAPALVIIEAFGGIRPMAKHLGLAVSTVQGWKERSAIPANRHDQIRAAAQKNSINIDPAVLRASAPSDGAPAQPQVIEGKATSVADKDSADKKTGDKKSEKAPDKAADKAADKAPDKAGDKPGGKPEAKTGGMSAASAASKSEARKADAAAKAPAAQRRSGFLPGLVLGVVLAAGVAAATVYTRPYWIGFIDGADGAQAEATTAALAGVETRLDELQAAMPADNSAALSGLSERLATLEAAVSQGGGQDPDTRAALESLNAQMARLSDRLEALEQELSALRSLAGTPSPELSSRLTSEAQRLDELLSAQSELAKRLTETEDALTAAEAAREGAPGSRETLMLLAMLQLRDALRGSGPYDQPLAMLQNLAGEDPALIPVIEPLERRASAGLPSLLDLQASFPDVARRIAAIEVGKEGEGWSAGVLRRMAEAVNLRPVGLVEGAAPTAVAARAEVKLNDGDLAGALAELDGLDGAAAEAAANWRAEAEARLAADRAVSTLGALVSERFSTLAGG